MSSRNLTTIMCHLLSKKRIICWLMINQILRSLQLRTSQNNRPSKKKIKKRNPKLKRCRN